ncbi:DUF6461 domain-containing protein [Streptomyces sp. NPDC049813]|uniref:DUF6461 domain-containing protein n=1 Tax=Streptomyces sp. NPDC049813 TaxID=3365597 RepID=UPI0037B2BD0D
MTGILWLLEEEDDWRDAVVWVRGITPPELAARIGGVPDSLSVPLTEDEAMAVVWDAAHDDDAVIRVGQAGPWAFAIEHGMPYAADRLAAVSRGGVEAVRLDPCVDHPPSMFSFARDGEIVCGFGIGEEVWRWGTHPDLLLAELIAADVLTSEGEYARDDISESSQDRDRHTLALLEARFGLSLPREDIEGRPLPAYLLR